MRTHEATVAASAAVLSLRDQRRTVSSALALLVLGVLAGLVPLAHARPPDPTWIAGVYDDADLDDVLIATLSADVTSPTTPAVRAPVACGHRLFRPHPVVRDHRPRLTPNRSPPLPPV